VLLLAACASTRLTVSGAPVSGHIRALSVPEIQAAVAAMRANLPQIRTQHLTHIRIINNNTVYLSYREAGQYYSTPHEVERVGGYWHYTGHIVIGLSD
jgi:hypothetical protein